MMKRTTTLAAALIAALGATALPATAQDRGDGPRGPRGPMFSFEEMDTNGDGKLTQEEIEAHAAAKFAEADTDGDGALSAEEMIARMETHRAERMKRGAERMIERRDTNDDGKLSAEEMMPKNRGEMFARMDLDEDGTVTKTEMDIVRKTMRDHRADHGKRWMKRDKSE